MSAEMLLRDALYYCVIFLHFSPLLSMPKLHADCNANITIQCSTTHQTSEYRVITWYKVNHTSQAGIIRKSQKGIPKRYNYSREAWLDNQGNLILPWLKPEDSGIYQCLLGAFVGEKNERRRLELHVSECVTAASPIFTNVSIVRNSSKVPQGHIEFPAVWVASGFSLVGFLKALLCFLCIWVPLMVKRRLKMQT